MNSRFSLPTTALALSLAAVLGTAFLLLLAAEGGTYDTTAPISNYLQPIFLILIASALCGAAAWAVVFALKRDGYHRMEWIAFLPSNYGGRSPFDTRPFPKM